MRKLACLALCLSIASEGWGQACTNATFGSYSCVQSCNGVGFSETTQDCAFTSNVTAGNEIVFVGFDVGGAATLSVTGCTNASFSQPDAQNDTTAAYWVAKVNTTGACTITLNDGSVSATLEVMAVEISGSNNTVDAHAFSTIGFTSANTQVNSPNITTTVNGDLVVGAWFDDGGGGLTWTAVAPSSILFSAGDNAIVGFSQSSSGANTKTTISYSGATSFSDATVALKPTGGTSAGGSYNKLMRLERDE